MLDDIFALSQHFLELKLSPYRRYFIRTVDLSHRLSLVMGPRGVGKTTTLVQYLLDQVDGNRFDKRILYVQVDHLALGDITLYAIAEEFVQLGGKWLALDEIHRYTDWSKELKSITDTFPELTVIASGSSALEIHKGSHDLSRRALHYEMVGLSFREYLELSLSIDLPQRDLSSILQEHEQVASEIVGVLAQQESKVLSLFADYLRRGFYPYTREFAREAAYFMTLEQNLHTTLESDLVAVHPQLTGNTIKKIKQLVTFIAEAVPFAPNWNKIKSVLDIGDTRTVKTYFDYLERAGIIRTVPKATRKLSGLESIAKVYLSNTNQLASLSHTDNRGTMRETFFLSMLDMAHQVRVPGEGDFVVDDTHLFEVGGRRKSFDQIREQGNAYLALDGLEKGAGAKIPLWIFGFLY